MEARWHGRSLRRWGVRCLELGPTGSLLEEVFQSRYGLSENMRPLGGQGPWLGALTAHSDVGASEGPERPWPWPPLAPTLSHPQDPGSSV